MKKKDRREIVAGYAANIFKMRTVPLYLDLAALERVEASLPGKSSGLKGRQGFLHPWAGDCTAKLAPGRRPYQAYAGRENITTTTTTR